MKLHLILALSAAALLAGCSKCSQQPPTEPPAVESTAPAEPSTVEGATSETLPPAEQMGEELPPAEGEGSAE